MKKLYLFRPKNFFYETNNLNHLCSSISISFLQRREQKLKNLLKLTATVSATEDSNPKKKPWVAVDDSTAMKNWMALCYTRRTAQNAC
jgi:hypothetical protein